MKFIWLLHLKKTEYQCFKIPMGTPVNYLKKNKYSVSLTYRNRSIFRD